jgi:hypothetical protein
VLAVVDLAAMRSALKRLGGDPARINPTIPVDPGACAAGLAVRGEVLPQWRNPPIGGQVAAWLST